ncbi:melanocortin receptor 4-like [Mercenaria mercenaria]|uniref:melanocortin receptor 4-like n=1 Tax=Mercenaria mercenaria TaxID=6596 RepID=UPI001E1DAA78|nr:melanocortin receptor 4-like [Mercenaria mercenaria]
MAKLAVNYTEFSIVTQMAAEFTALNHATENALNNMRNSNVTESVSNVTDNWNISTSMYYDDYEEVGAFDNPFNVVKLIVCILGLIANIMSVTATVHIPHGLTTHSKLIISLGVSDSLILIAALGHNFLYITSSVECIYIIKRVLHDTGVLATLLNLLAMAADHYLAIMKPMSYSRFMTRLRCNCSILAIWTVSLIAGLLEIIVGQFIKAEIGFEDFSFCSKLLIDQFDAELIMPVLIFVVLFGVVLFYTKIYFVAKSIISRDRMLYHDEMHNYKAIITTMLIIGTFIIFWTPLAIFKIYTHINAEASYHSDKDQLELAEDLMFLLLLLNSLVDPLIYATRLQEVQRGYKVLFYKVFPDRRFSINEEEFRHQNASFCSKRRDTLHTFVGDTAGCSSPDSPSDKLSDFEKKFEESSFMPDHCCVQK